MLSAGKAVVQIKLFENQSHQKPEGKIVQSDVSAYTVAGPVIVPGDYLFFIQKFSGKIFNCVN